MSTPLRRYIVPCLCALCLLGLVADRYLPLWRDAYFHTPGGEVLRLASGVEIPTNRWISLGDRFADVSFGQIGDGKSRTHYLIEDHDFSRRAELVTPTDRRTAVVVDFRGEHPSGLRQFWLRSERPEP